jgi:hypothetical protein
LPIVDVHEEPCGATSEPEVADPLGNPSGQAPGISSGCAGSPTTHIRRNGLFSKRRGADQPLTSSRMSRIICN